MAINAEQWQGKLSKLGLSAYEARVYLALLGEGSAAPAKLIRKSGVPQPRVYQALGVLVERGFALLTLGEGKTYRAVSPKAVFELHRKRQESAFAAAMDEMDREMDALERASPEEPSVDPASYGIRVVRGAASMEEAVAGLMGNAREEVCFALRYPPVMLNRQGAIPELRKRGVKVRFIAERKFMEDPNFADLFRASAREFKDLRWVEQVPVRLVLIDRKHYVLPLDESGGGATLLVVPNEVVAAGMQRWFEMLWAVAQDAATFPVTVTNTQS